MERINDTVHFLAQENVNWPAVLFQCLEMTKKSSPCFMGLREKYKFKRAVSSFKKVRSLSDKP